MQGVLVVGKASVKPGISTAACRLGISGNGIDEKVQVSYGLNSAFCKGSLNQVGPSIFFPSHRAKPSIGAISNTRKRNVCARADGSQGKTSGRIAPLELESPTGQFLSQILRSHPHLLPAAIDQQLERLAADRDAAAQQELPSTSNTELVLYRRIAELKAEERRKALEEIIYALIIQKFMDAGISLIPGISVPADISGKVDTWPNQDRQLEAVHSPEALEMIREHMGLVLVNRKEVSDSSTVGQISKLRLGQVYAASVVYGYFLRRVDQRFQLEKSMKMLPFDLNKEIDAEEINNTHPELGGSNQDNSASQGAAAAAAAVAAMAGASASAGSDFNHIVFGQVGAKPSKLRAYVMSFDPDTLKRYATMKSKEGVNIIEKHAEALFGRPEIQITHDGSMAVAKDDIIRISYTGLTSLVLEALTFGSFLWDVESYVDSRYHFVKK
uniref:UV-B-induced protein At3g17800, chloroplastic n=1 Tax=Araucaria cunninghamii TaxID=56994 RepID=A0A0D6QYG2_ARACU